MDLRKKLQLKPDQYLEILRTPELLSPILVAMEQVGDELTEAALLIFVTDRVVLEDCQILIVEAASKDRLTWVAYPKSGQLGTDLNRNSLVAFLSENGVQPVRQIAIDDVWSALRFRPA